MIENADGPQDRSRPTSSAAAETAVAALFTSAPADPYSVYACLRAVAPIHRTPDGLWVLSRYADVAAALRDPRLGREGFERHFVPDGAPARDVKSLEAAGHRQSMLFRDPPHHTRLREAAFHAFTPRAVAALRPQIESHAEALVARAVRMGAFDVIDDLAAPLPRAIIGDLLGIPEADRRALAGWSTVLARSLDALPIPADRALLAGGQAARRALGAYVRQLIASRPPTPGRTLLDTLGAMADQDGLLSEAEVVAMAVLLLVAGTETTVSLIGTTVLALLHDPVQLTQIRAEPWRIPAAIEEALRHESPVQRTWRLATTEVALDGRTLPKGALVVCLLGAANRDPARFPNPDRFDLSRRPLGHLAFGAGVHACLGSGLARLEAQVAVETLLRHCPRLALAGRPRWRPTSTLRGLATLPITS